MKPSIKNRIFAALFLFALSAFFISPQRSNAQTDNTTSSAWYLIQQSKSSLAAIGLDASNNGWAASSGASATPNTRMLQLQNNQLVDSRYVFSNTSISEISLSQDGKTGWALGNGPQDHPRAVLLQLVDGKWSEYNDPVISSAVASLSDMTLDADARNGWALGLANAETIRSSRVLRLSDGKWSVADTAIPNAVGLMNIAADFTLKHVWASGVDVAGDAALLYMQDDKWVQIEQEIGYFVIFDLAVDQDGNGWAGLDTNDEPVNSPSPTGFIRISADNSVKLVASDLFAQSAEIYFNRLELDANGNGWAIGNHISAGSGSPELVILSLRGDKISGQQYPQGAVIAGVANQQPLFGQAQDLAIGANNIAYAVTYEGGLLRYGPLPATGAIPAPAPRLAGVEQCFSQTNACLHGSFLQFWKNNDGLERFGMPITGELYERLEDGNVYRVQYTERARFEDHPEVKNSKYQVLLGLLGDKLAKGRKSETPFQTADKGQNTTFFSATSHNVSGPIGAYWQKNGGVAVFGYPISEPFTEKSQTDGKSYLVQYFERNRLEYHPEQKDTANQILLGLLGVQQYQAVYGKKP